MIKNKIENMVTAGNFDGRKATGIPRHKYLDALSPWYNHDKNTDLIPDTGNRLRWVYTYLNTPLCLKSS